MNFAVNVTTNLTKLNNLLDDAIDVASEALANQIMNDSLQYIPKQEGILRSSGRIETTEKKGERVLVWNTPYAAKQWFGVGIHHYTTPGTGKMWVETARTSVTRNAWAMVVRKAFLKRMGK